MTLELAITQQEVQRLSESLGGGRNMGNFETQICKRRKSPWRGNDDSVDDEDNVENDGNPRCNMMAKILARRVQTH
jgi:hypothetical protein